MVFIYLFFTCTSGTTAPRGKRTGCCCITSYTPTKVRAWRPCSITRPGRCWQQALHRSWQHCLPHLEQRGQVAWGMASFQVRTPWPHLTSPNSRRLCSRPFIQCPAARSLGKHSHRQPPAPAPVSLGHSAGHKSRALLHIPWGCAAGLSCVTHSRLLFLASPSL